MDTGVFQRIHDRLLAQRQNLTSWLSATPAPKKELRLGPFDERAVRTRLQVLDTAIDQAENQTLGLCEVCHDYIEPRRLEMDYTTCVCLDHFSPEERSRLEFELELSVQVQQALLPHEAPVIPGLEVAAFSRPAEIVGGDYFDFFPFQDRAHGLVIGDVAGHGMSASLLMASLQASLRTLILDYAAPAEVVQRLNRLFYHNIRMTQFVTLFVARFEPQTSTLVYCNAGHNPPLLYRTRANGQEPIVWLRPTGAAIGLVEAFQFDTGTVNLVPGDVLLLYTDGVTECTNPQFEEFGEERLIGLVRAGAHLPAQTLVRELRQQLLNFTAGRPLADDTTIVVCKIQAPA